jgi:transcriptional regulator of arginine metabolism
MSVKSVRLQKILELIEHSRIDTQEQLQELLAARENIQTTQATISRDIKELGLVKVSDGEGNYYYALGQRDKGNLEKRYRAVFAQSLMSVDYAGHITCIRCHTGMANAACAALDTMGFSGVVGTLAGDDTIFVLMRTEEQAKALADQVAEILNEH